MLYLSTLIFLPIFGIIIISCLPKVYRIDWPRLVSITIFVSQLVLAVYVLWIVNISGYADNYYKQFILVENYSWIHFNISKTLSFNIIYLLGADRINILLVVLSAFVFLIASVLSKDLKENRRSYYSLVMLVSTAVTGCFFALDLVLFFIFYELMLFPLFFLIVIWGYGKKLLAGIKFFVFTFSASLLILLGIIIIGIFAYDHVGIQNFNVIKLFEIINKKHYLFTSLSSNNQYFFNLLVFGLMFVGFAVKIPLFPLHLWLPQAHTCASTPISIILAGISLKVGFYGLFRFVYGLFPALSLQFSQFIVYWSLFTIIYAGLNAFKSKDLKEMVAWSSISHMGFAMVGLASLTIEGINGAILQLLSHGLLAIALFLIPHFIYVRVNDRLIYNFTGLYNIMPKYISVSTLIFFVSMGLPGFSPFIAELLILLSLIKMFLLNNINILIAVPFLLALFIGVLYWLKIIKGMFLGQLLLKDNSYNQRLCDISFKESWTVIIVMLLVLLLGLYPNLIFNITDQPADAFIKYIYIK